MPIFKTPVLYKTVNKRMREWMKEKNWITWIVDLKLSKKLKRKMKKKMGFAKLCIRNVRVVVAKLRIWTDLEKKSEQNNERMKEWMNERMNEGRMNEWKNEWKNEWRNEWKNGKMNERINKRMTERMTEWKNKWKNDWKKGRWGCLNCELWITDTGL